MAVAVHMPVRLRLDAEAMERRLPEVEIALDRALRRALQRSRRHVVPAGSRVAIQAHPPAIAWHGDGLDAASRASREAVERAVRVAIARAMEELEEASPEPAALRTPRERRNPARVRSLGRYAVDSYEGGTAVVPLAEPPPPPAPVWDVWTTIPPGITAWRAFHQAEAIAWAAGRSGTVGLLVQRDWGWLLFVSSDGFQSRAATEVADFSFQLVLEPVRDGDGFRFEERPLMPRPIPATLTQVEVPPPGEAREQFIHDTFGPTLRRQIRDRLDSDEARGEMLLGEAEYEASVERALDAAVATLAGMIPDARRHLLRLDFGDGTVFNVAIPGDLAALIGWSGAPAVVLPFTMVPDAGALDLGVGGDGAGGGGTGSGRAAAGTATGGQASDGTAARDGAEAGDGEGGSRYGIFGEGTSARGRRFPMPPPGIFDERIACAPFLGTEADPATLGGVGQQITALVQEIADRLGIQPCPHPATFSVIAASAIGAFARAVGQRAGNEGTGRSAMRPAGARGNMGNLSFTPTASPSVQLLRRLAQAAAATSRLIRLVAGVHNGAGGAQLAAPYAGRHHAWTIEYINTAHGHLERSVGQIFTAGCQVVMLQLLATSAEQIAARQRNLRAYAPLFQEVMLSGLSDLGALTELRDRLAAHERARVVQDVIRPLPGWPAAARALADACVATGGFAHMRGAAQDIVEEGGVPRIRDSRGFLWTRQALETAIAQKRGAAESIDPLIQQFTDLPEAVEAFRADPTAAERILGDLLADMARRNQEQTEKARGDRLFGLQAARIARDAAAAQVPGAPYALSGTHILAHELLGEFFDGDRIWGDGIRDALTGEEAKENLRLFGEFGALTALAVLCPPAAPAAVVAGVFVAGVEVYHARSRLELHRALINPELVLNRAELELELYIAYAGVALSLLPEARTAIRAASIGVRGGLRRGAVAGARLAGRSVMRHASRQVTTALQRELLPALLQEVATGLAMQHVIETALGPVLARVERELALRRGVGGMAGAEALIQAIERDAGRRAEAPLPPGLDGEGG